MKTRERIFPRLNNAQMLAVLLELSKPNLNLVPLTDLEFSQIIEIRIPLKKGEKKDGTAT